MIIELKTAKILAPEHEAQVLGYLKSARLEHGMLINFGSYKFEIRKFVCRNRSPRERKQHQEFSAFSSLRSLRLNNSGSDIEPEQQDIPIANLVIASFDAIMPGFPRAAD